MVGAAPSLRPVEGPSLSRVPDARRGRRPGAAGDPRTHRAGQAT